MFENVLIFVLIFSLTPNYLEQYKAWLSWSTLIPGSQCLNHYHKINLARLGGPLLDLKVKILLQMEMINERRKSANLLRPQASNPCALWSYLITMCPVSLLSLSFSLYLANDASARQILVSWYSYQQSAVQTKCPPTPYSPFVPQLSLPHEDLSSKSWVDFALPGFLVQPQVKGTLELLNFWLRLPTSLCPLSPYLWEHFP